MGHSIESSGLTMPLSGRYNPDVFKFCTLRLMLSQAEGPNTIDAFQLPRPNEFIPKRLDIDQREVTRVCLDQSLLHGTI
jgi:hypothetical protein